MSMRELGLVSDAMERRAAPASPEWTLVLAGARFPPDEAGLHGLSRDLPNARLDWRRVVEIAGQHRVAPILYSTLKRGETPRVPRAPLQALERAYLATAARNAALFRALEAVLEALSTAQMPVIVLKGAALADTVYSERALRPMNDIDLLLRDEDLGKAETQLRVAGYEPVDDPETRNDLRHKHHHWVFRHTKALLSGIPLELHWNLDPPGWPFRADVGALWSRAVSARIAGVAAMVLAPEDQLLHLCTHVCRHRFKNGLLTLCDIAAVIAHYGDRIDWRRLETGAAEWRAERHAYVPLQLAAELVGAGVPSSTLGRLEGSGSDGHLLDLARDRILEEKGSLRAAAELALRWRQRGPKGVLAALRRTLSREVAAGGGSRSLLRRYAPLTWPLLRHPRRFAAVARREAGKSRLDSWCSATPNEGAASP